MTEHLFQQRSHYVLRLRLTDDAQSNISLNHYLLTIDDNRLAWLRLADSLS